MDIEIKEIKDKEGNVIDKIAKVTVQTTQVNEYKQSDLLKLKEQLQNTLNEINKKLLEFD